MQRLIIPTLLFLLNLGITNSQWVSNYWGSSTGDMNILNARGMAVAIDRQRNCIVTGYIYNAETNNDIMVIKYGEEGDTIWTRTYSGSGNSEDKAWGIVVDSDNNIYITGTATVAGRSYDLIVMKYNKHGVLKWVKTWGATSGEREDMGLAIALDDDEDNVYVTGYCTNNDGYRDLILQKYTTNNGTLKFTKKQDGPENMDSEGHGIAVDENGRIYVTGYTTLENQQKNIITIKFNSHGSKQWQRQYNGSANGDDEAFGIAVDDNNNAYVTGYLTTNNNTDAVLLRYNSNGSLNWAETYNGEGGSSEDKAWGIVVDANRNIVYITGQTSSVSNGLDYLTIKYKTNGNERWVKTYNGPGNGDDVANAIALMNSNKIIVTGASWGINENYDYATVKFNGNGSINNVYRYSMTSNSNDIAKDVEVSSNSGNNIYVTGYSELIIEGSNPSSAATTVMILSKDDEETVNSVTPTKFNLYQNYPNPFNPSTTIKFDISNTANVKLVIYDMLGRVVDVLVNQDLAAGSYSIVYTNKNLSSGIYFYELASGDFKTIKKMTLVK
ncbi:MAG: SBBP repeat-containing protein [Chlorobi bacterium]|nr:SBBP repeat-containing protein [Chlorobiota bacterium]